MSCILTCVFLKFFPSLLFPLNQVGSILDLGLSKVTVSLNRQCRTGTQSFFLDGADRTMI